MPYNKYLKIVCAFAAAFIIGGCAGNTVSETQGSDESVNVVNVRQLITKDNKTSRVIMWQSSNKNNYVLEYKKQGTYKLAAVSAKDKSFTDGEANYLQYESRLDNLTANTVYEYRINTDKNKGAWHKLQTERGGDFTALIFPDSQSSDYSGWKQLANEAYKRHAEADFFINMGDLADNGKDAYQWRQWLDAVSAFSSEIPFAPVIGNHETYTLNWTMDKPNAYLKLFTVPDNGVNKYQGQFYSFDYGDVHFVSLDTNNSEMAALQPALLQDEIAWLEKDLANSTAKWKIILQHRDILLYGFNNREGTREHFIDIGEQLMPVFEKYNVDAVLSAHLHTYRRRKPLRNFAPSDNGITYILTGVAGNVRYADLWKDSFFDAARAPKPETANYLTMQVKNGDITFSAFLPDGTKFDEVTLHK